MKNNLENLHIVTKTHEGEAKTVLLIHGLASSSSTWSKLSKDLYKEGYNIVAPDLYGHGKSPHKEKYSVTLWADSIIEALPNKPDIIIGHSIGGLIAAEIQTRLKTAQLILLDPVYFLPNDKLMLRSIQLTFKELMRSASYYNSKNNHKNLTVKVEKRREYLNFARWDTKSVDALKASPATIVKCIKEQSAKILIIHANRSYIAPKHRLKNAVTYNTKLVSIKSGHNVHIQKYDLVKEELFNFITR